MFESIVADLLNKFLGDYVENVDRSKLKLAVWGGNIILKNIDIKQNALEDLDLPLKIAFGYLSELILKIPWKNIYSSPVTAVIDGLYVIITPSAVQKYDEEKEKKIFQETKNEVLQAAEKVKIREAKKLKHRNKKQDSFKEKILTQIIRNLQVKVKNVHIRYEDEFINSNSPFAAGITLHNLLFETTDESWKPCIVKETVKIFNKLVNIDSLGIYWNSSSKLFSKMDSDNRRRAMLQAIASKNHKPINHSFLLKPVTLSARIVLNPKPEADGSNFSIPKVWLNIIVDHVFIEMSKSQYQDIVHLIEALDRMSIASIYRKHRPDKPYKGNAKLWWEFAFKCVLEDIQRKRRNWSWIHMQQHRQTCCKYKDLYKEKLLSKKLSQNIRQQIDDCENKLDVFNITLMRRKAEVDVSHKLKSKASHSGRRFSSLFCDSLKTKKTNSNVRGDIVKKLNEAMTESEKEKLYKAIGYQENALPVEYPREFIANKVIFELNKFVISIIDDTKVIEIMMVDSKGISSLIEHRPAAEAIKLDMQVRDFTMFGSLSSDEKRPQVIKLENLSAPEKSTVLQILVETNPLDQLCDQKINVLTMPLEIIFDALTVNNLNEMFKLPHTLQTYQLQADATKKLEEFKYRTSLGLEDVFDQHKTLDLNIDIKPSYIVIPEYGDLKKSQNVLVINLGNFQMQSVQRETKSSLSQKKFVKKEEAKKEENETVMTEGYNKFHIHLQNLVLLLTKAGNDWRKHTEEEMSTTNLLYPVTVDVSLMKAIFTNDSQMPKIKIYGELPLLNLAFSDLKLQNLMNIIQSIPFPEGQPYYNPERKETLSSAVTTDIRQVQAKPLKEVIQLETLVNYDNAREDKQCTYGTKENEASELTKLQLNLEIKRISISLSHQVDGIEKQIMGLELHRLGTYVCIHTFDMSADIFLGGIYLEHKEYLTPDKQVLYLLNTPFTSSTSENFFTLNILQADKKGPKFVTHYESTFQKVFVRFAHLDIMLHQEALLSLIKFASNLTSHKEQPQKSAVSRTAVNELKHQLAQISNEKKHSKRKYKDDNIIDTIASVELSSLCISLCTSNMNIMSMQIREMDGEVKLLKSKTVLACCLKEILVTNSIPNILYSKILSTVSEEVLRVEIVLNKSKEEKYLDITSVDMELKVFLGAVKVVFLYFYAYKILNFISEFETAKKKLTEASIVAVEMALHGMEEAYQKATKVSLDIFLKAPLIIIPQNVSSDIAVVADLGTLKLHNYFKVVNDPSDCGTPTIFDNLSLELFDLKFSSAVVHTASANILSESMLLKPINMTLEVIRNLSIGCYNNIPEIVVKGKLDGMEMTLNQGDFSIIMKVLLENFDAVHQSSSSPEFIARATTAEKVIVKKLVKEETKNTEFIELVFKKATFTFQLDSFKVSLFEGNSNMSSDMSKRKPECALAELEFLTIAIKGEVLSDGFLWANIILKNCILDDIRVVRKKGITRLMECSSVASNDNQNMIDIIFIQYSSQERFLDVKISSFSLILNLLYLMTLRDFFSKAMPDKIISPQSTITLKPKTVSNHADTDSRACITITLDIKQPDLVLMEDMEDYNSNAVILNFQMNAKVSVSPDAQLVNGLISKFQLFTACFNPELREKTISEILRPCDIIICSNSPKMRSQHINIEFTRICLNISPNTTHIMTKILSGLLHQQSSKKIEEEKCCENYSELWLPKKLEECSFWFLETVVFAEEALINDATLPAEDSVQAEADSELLMLTMKTIILTVEIGRGKQTVPMILMEAAFQAEIQNWSSSLHVESFFLIEIAYYNEKLALWEPLLEPIEQSTGKSKPWELVVEVTKNPELPEAPAENGESYEVSFFPPVMSIVIFSSDVMELTVSKIALEGLNNLIQAFGEVVKNTHKFKHTQTEVSYVIKNHLGLPVHVILPNDTSQVVGQNQSSFKEVLLESGNTLYLKCSSTKESESNISILNQQNVKVEEILCLKIVTHQVNSVRKLNISQVGKRYYQLPIKTYTDDLWAFVVDVSLLHGSKIVTFHGCITLYNHLSVSFELYYKKPSGNELQICGLVEPKKMCFVPLHGIYSLTSELFFKPTKGSNTICAEPFVWKDLINEPNTFKTLECTGYGDVESNFFFKLFGEVEQILYEESMKRTVMSTCYMLHLRPTASLRNLLPLIVTYTIQGMKEEYILDEGSTHDLTFAYPGKTYLQIKLPNYLDQIWVCTKELNPAVTELSVWTFSSTVLDKELTLDLGMHTRKCEGYLDMEIYCPFWMINKTNLFLAYKGEKHNDTSHPGNLNIPVLFSFRTKNFFSKSKVSIKVEDSEWSNEFSVDAVGNCGSVAARVKNGKIYCVSVQIMLSQSSLTKIVVFTPFYLLTNKSKCNIQIKEDLESAQWLTVPAGECVPFWPDQTKKSGVVVKYDGFKDQSAPFSFKEPHSHLLRLAGIKGAIYVDCQYRESSTVLNFCDYYEGSAQVRLVNHTDSFTVKYSQCGKKEKQQLEPQHCILYTWEDPMGEKKLAWSCGQKLYENNLIQDGIGEFFADKDTKMYWVSFLDGFQRTILFTEDVALVTAAQVAGELEQHEQEITVSLLGVGISFVDSESRSEIMYVSFANSGVMWEQCKLKSLSFKPVSVQENMLLETGYQKYLNETKLGKLTNSRKFLDEKIEIDFSEMLMYKPNKRHIRRTFQVGVWVQYSSSAHLTQLHAKINKLQIDNQLTDCVFPVVLAPVPPPKSVTSDSIPKPFTEVSIMMRKAEHSLLNQFKYFKLLVQEFHVKVDQSFLNSLLAFFSSGEKGYKNYAELLKKDKEILKYNLKAFVTIYSFHDQKNFYDILHFSPIKVHLSFSITGGGHYLNQPNPIHSELINLLFQSVGITVTEIQDVIFKLNYFEKQNVFLSHRQILSDAIIHYKRQALKQLYMFVLGLDVIGNPVGLLLEMGEGVGDLFYEPFQGAVQGPEEFVEGLAIGVKSLLRHAVGGAAGAVSRITGTLGKGVAALTMDQEYQKKRRQQRNRQPGAVRQGLAQSGKGFVMGVFEGVTGVVMKPIEGAKEEGFGGFFKGVGKGLIGIVARPTSGVVDLASSGLEAVVKVTELSDEIKRVRYPRYIHPDTVIKPYNVTEAEGNEILQEVRKGCFATTDEYMAHFPVSSDGKNHLLLTNRRVMFIYHGDIFGQWIMDWQITWNDLMETPQVTERGIKFVLKEPMKKLGGLGGSGQTIKFLHIYDPKLCTCIVEKIKEAMNQ
ncbi:vacuolar protein sorting-associated protein 13C-like [Limulus polyphemus]|uniref:Vacuolar protein sorting-associated protein 13C-like n=1 Tax=Limulus polyphemus TaxID=6850 RepID=A0ABM1TS58_LIMPO|nr:vacuolar protein sorting-associated protein 13C-like [Limulus polyphemus]